MSTWFLSQLLDLRRSPLRWLVALVVLVAGLASGSGVVAAETGVAAKHVETSAAVEVDGNIGPAHVGSNSVVFDDGVLGCCVAPQRLGDLTPGEVRRIQDVVNQAGRPLEVAGSAASGTRRGVGSSLPIGKGPGTRSDIDYLVPPGSLDNYRGLTEGLPALDPGSGVIPGTHNPHIGPAIRFEPDAEPYFVPGAAE